MSTHHGFWIAATDNRVFDGIVTRHLIGHGNIIAIHAYFESDSYSFADIVGRLKVLPPSPPVRVLFYTWAGRKPTDGDTIGSVPTLDDMENQLNLLLKDKETGDPLTISEGAREFIALDPRVPKARAWLSDRVRTVADLVRSDGVALDGAIRSPRFLNQCLVVPLEMRRLTRRTTRTGAGSGISTARICLPPDPTRDGSNTPGS
jgi:hypothetical protein